MRLPIPGRIVRALAILLATPIVAVVLLAGWLIVPGWWDHRTHQLPFDSARWAVNDKSDPNWSDRRQMADDLLERHPLTGKTRDEIIALLGQPDLTNSQGIPSTPPTSTLRYCLGLDIDPPFLGEEDCLDIDFGVDDRVTQAERVDVFME